MIGFPLGTFGERSDFILAQSRNSLVNSNFLAAGLFFVMNNELGGEQSQFFTLRVWCEEVEDGRTEIRGTLKHVLSGKTTHFRDWQTLIGLIEATWAGNEKISSR